MWNTKSNLLKLPREMILKSLIVLLGIVVSCGILNGQIVITETQSTSTIIGGDRGGSSSTTNEAYRHEFAPPAIPSCPGFTFSPNAIEIDIDITAVNNVLLCDGIRNFARVYGLTAGAPCAINAPNNSCNFLDE